MYYIKAYVNNSIYAAVADTDLLDLRTDDDDDSDSPFNSTQMRWLRLVMCPG
jgi:hypothetical protein